MNDIKIITSPSVYVLGRQQVDTPELVRFLDDHGVTWSTDTTVAAEELCETAGRVCYMSFSKPRPGGNAAYLQHIKEVGHGSVLEHAVFNLLITGVSRTLSHELVRHRAGWGYSQLSQRYVDESRGEYVLPHALRDEWAAYKAWDGKMNDGFTRGVSAAMEWENSIKCDHEIYIEQVEYHLSKFTEGTPTERRKSARQAARSVLPNATETKIFCTTNARALRHFFEQRGSRHAEPEIRKLANVIQGVMAKESPNLFGDYTRFDLGDGTVELSTKYPKI